MKILIENLVYDHCKMAIQNVLDKLNLKSQAVYLDEIDLVMRPST